MIFIINLKYSILQSFLNKKIITVLIVHFFLRILVIYSWKCLQTDTCYNYSIQSLWHALYKLSGIFQKKILLTPPSLDSPHPESLFTEFLRFIFTSLCHPQVCFWSDNMILMIPSRPLKTSQLLSSFLSRFPGEISTYLKLNVLTNSLSPLLEHIYLSSSIDGMPP